MFRAPHFLMVYHVSIIFEFRYLQLAQEKVKLETENRKLKYRITHLARNLEEAVTAQRAQ